MCWVVKEGVTTQHVLREGSSTAKEEQAGIWYVTALPV